METNEQGLTTEERIMFSILGIILLIAVGVLIINSISAKERTLDDETPITEKQDTQTQTKDENTTKDTTSSLIEETVVEEVKSSPLISRKTSVKTTSIPKKQNTKQDVAKVEIPTQEKNEESISPQPTENEWDFNENIVTEAYENDVIKIDKTVVLKDGTRQEAAVTVRKQIENTYMIEKIVDDQLTVTEGNYIYYYTYGNKTKEILLIVKKELPITDVNFLEITEEETEEIADIKNLLANSTIKYEKNNIHIELPKTSSSKVPILIALPDELVESSILWANEYVSISQENNTWYQSIAANEKILWLDCSGLSTENELTLWIEGHNYGITITIETKEEEEAQDEKEKNEEEEDQINREEEDSSEKEELEPSEPTLEESLEHSFEQSNVEMDESLEINNIEVDPIT